MDPNTRTVTLAGIETCDVACDVGYESAAASTGRMECDWTAETTGTIFQSTPLQCSMIECAALSGLENMVGDDSNGQTPCDLTAGTGSIALKGVSTCHLKCKPGYEIDPAGSQQLECSHQENGRPTAFVGGTGFTCKPSDCHVLEGDSMGGLDYTVADVFSCTAKQKVDREVCGTITVENECSAESTKCDWLSLTSVGTFARIADDTWTNIVWTMLADKAPIFVADASSPPAGVPGKVAVVKRAANQLHFGTDAKNLEAAGAVALIVLNNEEDVPNRLAANADSATVSIPVFLFGHSAGLEIEKYAKDNAAKFKLTLSRMTSKIDLKNQKSRWVLASGEVLSSSDTDFSDACQNLKTDETCTFDCKTGYNAYSSGRDMFGEAASGDYWQYEPQTLSCPGGTLTFDRDEAFDKNVVPKLATKKLGPSHQCFPGPCPVQPGVFPDFVTPEHASTAYPDRTSCSDLKVGGSCVQSCNTGYFTASKTFTCPDGVLAGTRMTCTPKVCEQSSFPNGVDVDPGECATMETNPSVPCKIGCSTGYFSSAGDSYYLCPDGNAALSSSTNHCVGQKSEDNPVCGALGTEGVCSPDTRCTWRPVDDLLCKPLTCTKFDLWPVGMEPSTNAADTCEGDVAYSCAAKDPAADVLLCTGKIDKAACDTEPAKCEFGVRRPFVTLVAISTVAETVTLTDGASLGRTLDGKSTWKRDRQSCAVQCNANYEIADATGNGNDLKCDTSALNAPATPPFTCVVKECAALDFSGGASSPAAQVGFNAAIQKTEHGCSNGEVLNGVNNAKCWAKCAAGFTAQGGQTSDQEGETAKVGLVTCAAGGKDLSYGLACAPNKCAAIPDSDQFATLGLEPSDDSDKCTPGIKLVQGTSCTVKCALGFSNAEATGSFACSAGSNEGNAASSDYVCEEASCQPASLIGGMTGDASNCNTPTDAADCNVPECAEGLTLKASTSKVCGIKCSAGYAPAGKDAAGTFTCTEGTDSVYSLVVSKDADGLDFGCVQNECAPYQFEDGSGVEGCDDVDGGLLAGQSCTLTCKSGFNGAPQTLACDPAAAEGAAPTTTISCSALPCDGYTPEAGVTPATTGTDDCELQDGVFKLDAVKNSCNFKCATGYSMTGAGAGTGTGVFSCGSVGGPIQTASQCEAQVCPSFSSAKVVGYATFCPGETDVLKANGECSQVCTSGYEVLNTATATETLTCGSGSDFKISGVVKQCQAKPCTANNFGTGVGYGAQCDGLVTDADCVQHCTTGYQDDNDGNGRRYSCADGVFEGTPLTCTPADCSHSINSNAGFGAECAGLVTDTECTQLCQGGYEDSPDKRAGVTYTCDAGAFAVKGGGAPLNCEPLNCPAPADPVIGHVEGEDLSTCTNLKTDGSCIHECGPMFKDGVGGEGMVYRCPAGVFQASDGALSCTPKSCSDAIPTGTGFSQKQVKDGGCIGFKAGDDDCTQTCTDGYHDPQHVDGQTYKCKTGSFSIAGGGELLQCTAKPCDDTMPKGLGFEDSCAGFLTDSAECTQICSDGYEDNNFGAGQVSTEMHRGYAVSRGFVFQTRHVQPCRK